MKDMSKQTPDAEIENVEIAASLSHEEPKPVPIETSPNSLEKLKHMAKLEDLITVDHAAAKAKVEGLANARLIAAAPDLSKHTPGKWTHDSQEALHIRAEDGGLVATLGWSNGRHFSKGRREYEEVQANARLIAAAPELLRALENVLAFEDPDSLEDQQKDARLRQARAHAWQGAKDAIAKATGDRP